MSIILISENANVLLKDMLKRKGHVLCEILKTASVYESISSHPDIYACNLGDELIVANDQLPFIENQLSAHCIKYIAGHSGLGYKYPGNIKFNAVKLGAYFVHNTSYTDPGLLNAAESQGLNIVHVNQGYTKCNVVKVDENSAITSDKGIAHALKSHGIETLVISPGYVKLEGFPYGFLGGTSGRVDNEIIFSGNLSAHPDFIRIKDFIEKNGSEIVFFENYPLEDIGSIIQL